MRQDELLQEIMNRYGVAAEYPWRRYPQYAVFRHADNRKWFAVLMNLPGRKLGLATEEEVAILNVKIRAEENSLLRGMDGVLPAYHMNKEHWVSLRLDVLPDATLLELLADSHGLTRAKMRRVPPPAIFHDQESIMPDITDTLRDDPAAQTATDAAYEQWFREKVARSLHDPRPAIAHDAAMALVEEELMRRRAKRATR